MAVKKLIPAQLEMHSGNDKVIVVTVLDQDSATIDITGITADFSVSNDRASAPLFTQTVGSGIVLSDPSNGELTVTIEDTDSEPLVGNYYFELTITDVAGRVSTVLHGSLNVLRNVN